MKLPEFEKPLVQWLWEIFDQDACLTYELMREKVKRNIESLNTNKP